MLAGIYRITSENGDYNNYLQYPWTSEISMIPFVSPMNLLQLNSYKDANTAPTLEKIEKLGIPIDIQGWNSDSHIFKDLIDEYRPKVIVEVGTWKGRSAINMANLCRNLGLDTTIYCIDTWLGGVDHLLSDKPIDKIPHSLGYPVLYYQFLANVFIENVHQMIVPVPQTSRNGLALLNYIGIEADMVYIDGSHEYSDVLDDVRGALRIRKKNGVIFGDDYQIDGVSRAVNSWSPEIIDNNFWIIR